MDDVLAPLERCGVGIIDLDIGADGIAYAARAGEAGAPARGARQETEPDLHLIEPARVGRREVEVHVRMACQPAVVLQFVRSEIVENDMQFHVRGVVGNDLVQKQEQLASTPTPVVPSFDLARGHVERGKERRL